MRSCEGIAIEGILHNVNLSNGASQPDHPDTLTPEQVNVAVMAFSLLAEPNRVRMLWALRDGELDVATLAGIADCRPTVASQHLSKLRLAGLVETARDGRRILYRLRGGHMRALLTEALFHADHQVSGHSTHD
jgi:DNA-binding transcriptional ArsR family regulator